MVVRVILWLYWVYIGIMENRMEAIQGLGVKTSRLRVMA